MRYYVLNKRNTEEYVKRITLGGNASFGEVRSCIQFETKEEAEGWKKGLYCSGYVDVVPVEITVLKGSEETAAVDQDEKVESDFFIKSEYEKASDSLAKAYQEINLCHETIVEQAKEIYYYKHANELCSKEK